MDWDLQKPLHNINIFWLRLSLPGILFITTTQKWSIQVIRPLRFFGPHQPGLTIKDLSLFEGNPAYFRPGNLAGLCESEVRVNCYRYDRLGGASIWNLELTVSDGLGSSDNFQEGWREWFSQDSRERPVPSVYTDLPTSLGILTTNSKPATFSKRNFREREENLTLSAAILSLGGWYHWNQFQRGISFYVFQV